MSSEDKVLCIEPHLGAPMVVRITSMGDRFPLARDMSCKTGDPCVEFYDRRYAGEPGFTSYGQFIRRYCLGTLLQNESAGLILSDEVPHWSIDPDTMERVRAWLRRDPSLKD